MRTAGGRTTIASPVGQDAAAASMFRAMVASARAQHHLLPLRPVRPLLRCDLHTAHNPQLVRYWLMLIRNEWMIGGIAALGRDFLAAGNVSNRNCGRQCVCAVLSVQNLCIQIERQWLDVLDENTRRMNPHSEHNGATRDGAVGARTATLTMSLREE
jgi:hypothetical protein